MNANEPTVYSQWLIEICTVMEVGEFYTPLLGRGRDGATYTAAVWGIFDDRALLIIPRASASQEKRDMSYPVRLQEAGDSRNVPAEGASVNVCFVVVDVHALEFFVEADFDARFSTTRRSSLKPADLPFSTTCLWPFVTDLFAVVSQKQSSVKWKHMPAYSILQFFAQKQGPTLAQLGVAVPTPISGRRPLAGWDTVYNGPSYLRESEVGRQLLLEGLKGCL